MFVDTHAHLTFEPLSDVIDGVLTRAQASKVNQIITIGIDPASHCQALALAESQPMVYAGLGFHPYAADKVSPASLTLLKEQLAHPQVVALGEIGLDYLKSPVAHDIQQQALIAQVELAQALDLPIIIHNREAIEDILTCLQPLAPLKGVMHCFTGSQREAERCLALGLHLGFNGIITFPSARDVQQVVPELPLEKILLETDCPYLAPQPVRGQTNAPEYIPHIATKIAELRGISVEEVGRQTTANARRLFGLGEDK